MADTSILFILYESAVGYGLFEVVSFDEIASLTVESCSTTVTDMTRLGRALKLHAFVPFTSAVEALENANAISEHAMTSTLHHFLEAHLPSSSSSSSSSKKKSKTIKSTAPFSLGVIDPGLANAIVEAFAATTTTTPLTCRSDDSIREIIRGCRTHFDTYIKGLLNTTNASTSTSASASNATSTATNNNLTATTQDTRMVTIKAQLGLGHSYSRSKVKFNPARSDNMIIQSIALLDQLDKDINTFAMRIREWYSWHFPELKDLVKDNIIYARTAAFIRDKSSLFLLSTTTTTSTSTTGSQNEEEEENEEEDEPMNGSTAANHNNKLQQLSDIVGDVDTATYIIAAAKTSMGMDCNTLDMINIMNFTQRMIKMAEYRKQLQYYLSDKMNMVAPNLSALIGDSVAARLISKVLHCTGLCLCSYQFHTMHRLTLCSAFF
jgi:nucleolar protein 56